MDYARWNSVVTDDMGSVVSNAQVTVRSTETGALASLYETRDGSAPKGNPFYTDSNGQIAFFAKGGSYTITAVSGTLSRAWSYVPIGTAQEYDIQGLAQYLNSGVVYFQAKAALDAFTPLQFPAAGAVLNDPVATRNGIYTNSGAGWLYGSAFPSAIARTVVTSGDANNPTLTLQAGINPSSPLMFYVDVATPNTGSVTLNVLGVGTGVVLNVNGDLLTSGEWQGRIMFTRESDGRYRLMNDPAAALSAAASATQAGSARDAAVAARTGSETARTQAATSATNAGNSATAAAGSASTASTQAGSAGASATAASNSATNASTRASEAATSATNAAASSVAASNSAGSASTSATNASNSATAASGSASTANTQANRSKTEADRAEAAAGGLINAVQFVPQTLTAGQQTQARTNIGAISASEVPAVPVTSVAGKTGAVTLAKSDVGLSNVDNTSDANKPISTATQYALNGKLGVTAQAADSARLGNKTAAAWQVEVAAKAGVYTGSDAGELNLPIGHTVLVWDGSFSINNTAVVRLAAGGDARSYTTLSSGGAVLNGVWSSRGQYKPTSAAATHLFQRVS